MKRTLPLFLLLLFAGAADGQLAPGTGTPPFGSLQSFGFGSVNLQNLNFNFTIPAGVSPGRGMNLQMGLSYNSFIWQNDGVAWVPSVGYGGTPTWGWNLTSPIGTIPFQYYSGQCQYISGGHVYYSTTYRYSSYYYVEPNGTAHAFNVQYNYIASPCYGAGTYGPFTGYATDNSGFYIDVSAPSSPVVYSPSGIKITPTSMTDTNGNSITSKVVNSSETDWTDTAGRVAVKIISSGTTIQYQMLDPSGTYQTITLNLLAQHILTNFGCSGVTEYAKPAYLPYSLSLPNGTSYDFTYEGTPGHSGYVTGRIGYVSGPGGAQYQFSYIGAANDGINCSDGTGTSFALSGTPKNPSGAWAFARTQTSGNWETTVTMPDAYTSPYQDQALYTFNSSGQETQRLIYQGNVSGGTLMREIDTTWATNGTPQSKVLVLEDGSTASETDTTFDSNGLLDSVSEYDWGTKSSKGNLIRTTTFTYLNSSTYMARNILNRVVTEAISDTNGTEYREDITYDGSGKINTPCITGAAEHDDTNFGCSFTTRGLPTSRTTYTSPANQSGGVTKNFTYDSLGNLRTAQVNCCQQKQWNFSSTTQYAFPDSIVNGSGTPSLTTSYTYNTYTGQVTKSTDANGQSTSNTFDCAGSA